MSTLIAKLENLQFFVDCHGRPCPEGDTLRQSPQLCRRSWSPVFRL